MIISPDNPIANYNAAQVDTTQSLTVTLSSDAVKELDLPEGQTVKGSVSEDGNSVTISTENGEVNLVGSFAQVSGEDVNVRVRSAETPADTEVKQGPQTEGQEPTRQSKLDTVFENTSAKLDNNADVEKLLTDLKAAIEGGESSVFGELDLFADLPPVEVEINKYDTEINSWAWDAPEARELEDVKLGETYVDFTDGEINSGEEEWMGFEQLLGNDEDWEINIDADIGDRDHIWLQGRVVDNHGRFNMWFDNVGTAAYAKQNINEVAQKIESFGIIIDHLGIAPYPRDRVENPPKSTFMVEV
tara:strand:- start:10 stop:915 length:906 start_codon:yes stop_codon:yes gene_type:complete